VQVLGDRASHVLQIQIEKHGGMESSAAKKLRALESENAGLKNLLAEQVLDNVMLRDVTSKNW